MVLLVIGGIAGAYYLGKNTNKTTLTPQPTSQVKSSSPTPEPNGSTETANWKVYTNQKYKFSFKYPENWYVLDQADQWNVIYVDSSPLEDPDIPRTHGIPSALQISIITNPQESLGFEGKHSKVEIGGVSGDKAISQKPIPEDDVFRTWILLNSSRMRLELVFPNTDTQGNHDTTFDKILSTFKFTQ